MGAFDDLTGAGKGPTPARRQGAFDDLVAAGKTPEADKEWWQKVADTGVAGRLAVGALRGAKNVIDVPAEWLADKFGAAPTLSDLVAGRGSEGQRVKAENDAAKAKFKAYLGDSTAAQLGQVGGEVIATLPVGGLLAAPVRGAQVLGAKAGLQALPRLLNPVATALETGGMTTGMAPAKTLAGKAADLSLRAGAGGANGYASAGVINPDEAGTGAGLGAAIPVAGKVISGATRSLRGGLSNAEQQLVALAKQHGIPMSAGQLSGSKPVQIIESVLENLPFTAGRQQAFKQGQQEAFNNAVGKTIGAPQTGALTPDALGAARTGISNRFTDLSQRNSMSVDNQLLNDLVAIAHDSSRYGGAKDLSAAVQNRIDDLLSQTNGAGQVPGKTYREFDSSLGKAMRAGGDQAPYLGQMQSAVRGAMDRSISPADQAAWRSARRDYQNLLAIAPVAARSEVGDISGRTLLGSVNQINKQAKFGNGGELGDLARVGRAFVADKIPNSGTAQRQLYQGLLQGGAGGLLTGYANGWDPTNMALGAGAALAGPRAVQSLLQSPAGLRLAEAMGKTNQAKSAGLENFLRLLNQGAVVAPVGLLSGAE